MRHATNRQSQKWYKKNPWKNPGNWNVDFWTRAIFLRVFFIWFLWSRFDGDFYLKYNLTFTSLQLRHSTKNLKMNIPRLLNLPNSVYLNLIWLCNKRRRFKNQIWLRWRSHHAWFEFQHTACIRNQKLEHFVLAKVNKAKRHTFHEYKTMRKELHINKCCPSHRAP